MKTGRSISLFPTSSAFNATRERGLYDSICNIGRLFQSPLSQCWSWSWLPRILWLAESRLHGDDSQCTNDNSRCGPVLSFVCSAWAPSWLQLSGPSRFMDFRPSPGPALVGLVILFYAALSPSYLKDWMGLVYLATSVVPMRVRQLSWWTRVW